MPEILQTILANIWYVLLVVLFFGGSIFVHELGHFLAARWRGLKIDRFSIGFGPKIFSWTRGGVEYRLSWIPLGGYVALPQLSDLGEIEGGSSSDVETLPPISYSDKMIVSVAGATFNVVFAFLLACVLWIAKLPMHAELDSTTVGYVIPTMDVRATDGSIRHVPSPAVEAGLETGDRIIAIDGKTIQDWQDISSAVFTGSGWADDGRRESIFVIERDGKQQTVVLHPRQSGDERLRQVGIMPAADIVVADVPRGSLAEVVGLRAGDRLVSYGGIPIRHPAAFNDLLEARATETVDLVVRRGDASLTLTVPPRPHPRVMGLARNSLAHRLGIHTGDVLLTVNAQAVASEKQFRELVSEDWNNPITIVVQRKDAELSFTVPPRPDKSPVGIIASRSLGSSYTTDIVEKQINPIEQCVTIVRQSYQQIVSLLNPRSDVGLRVMSTPIEIVRAYYDMAQAGIRDVIWLTIMINIALAIFNLLPIPILDGGHMLFATISKLRHRALPAEFELRTKTIFLALLLTMFLYVGYHNVVRWKRDADRDNAAAQIIWEGQEIPPPAAQ